MTYIWNYPGRLAIYRFNHFWLSSIYQILYMSENDLNQFNIARRPGNLAHTSHYRTLIWTYVSKHPRFNWSDWFKIPKDLKITSRRTLIIGYIPEYVEKNIYSGTTNVYKYDVVIHQLLLYLDYSNVYSDCVIRSRRWLHRYILVHDWPNL